MSKQEKASRLCHDCKNWELFGKSCFFYWERKKECSNHAVGDSSNVRFKKVDFSE